MAPNFLRDTTLTFLRQIVSAIYRPPFGKLWFTSVCWCPSAKPGSEVESRIYVGWVNMAIQFEAVCGPKFTIFWHDIRDPCNHQCTYQAVYIVFPMTYSVKIAVKLRRRRKKWFLGSRFVGGGDTPDFRHVFSNCAHFRQCGRFWLSSVQRARRVRGENKEKRKRRIP